MCRYFMPISCFVNLWDEQNKMSAQTREAFLKAYKCILVAAERRYDEEIFELGRKSLRIAMSFSLCADFNVSMNGMTVTGYVVKRISSGGVFTITLSFMVFQSFCLRITRSYSMR